MCFFLTANVAQKIKKTTEIKMDAPEVKKDQGSVVGTIAFWVLLALGIATAFFYLGTPCEEEEGDASAIKTFACGLAKLVSGTGEVLPQIVNSGFAYLISTGVLSGVGAIAASVLGYMKLKRRWNPQAEPNPIIDSGLKKIETTAAKALQNKTLPAYERTRITNMGKQAKGMRMQKRRGTKPRRKPPIRIGGRR